MKQVRLGRDGPMISQFGVGAMSFSGIYGDATEAESFAILDKAAEAGVTHIDTAAAYGDGRSERIIGAWFAANPGAREKTTVATKAAFRRVDGARTISNDPVWMEEMLDRSLSNLAIDAVDLFYAHRIEPGRAPEEVASEMGRLVEKGKAKAIGFSEIAPTTLRRAMEGHAVAAVQSEYSLQCRSPELGLVQACAELGVALVAFCPVGRGLLTDHPPDAEKIARSAFMTGNPRFQEPNLGFNIAASDRFRALAAEMGVPAAGLAVAWCMAQGDHVIPIPGTMNAAHFEELMAGTKLSLGVHDIARIEEVLPVGWCHGDRYSEAQWKGPEKYC